jgi:hypothetical protein
MEPGSSLSFPKMSILAPKFIGSDLVHKRISACIRFQNDLFPYGVQEHTMEHSSSGKMEVRNQLGKKLPAK